MSTPHTSPHFHLKWNVLLSLLSALDWLIQHTGLPSLSCVPRRETITFFPIPARYAAWIKNKPCLSHMKLLVITCSEAVKSCSSGPSFCRWIFCNPHVITPYSSSLLLPLWPRGLRPADSIQYAAREAKNGSFHDSLCDIVLGKPKRVLFSPGVQLTGKRVI